ncbi:MAG: FecR domain-containing protein [Rhodoplanes sp.]|uniref:FecR family protein n=1 Tax=Rhodoplanes sp. TaxID=1968906 RepID=UPI00185574D0|nr:FecR domain-containing protein [Rhodoplanes sp.]NVO17592.1 FecR domain-containing protein [Rhodoplanes sp.]
MMQPQAMILEDEALDRLIRATSGDSTVEDLRELESWRARSAAHADAYRRALAVWEALGTAARECATVRDRVPSAVGVHAGGVVISRRAMLAGGAMAAAAATAAVVVSRPPLGLWPSLSDLLADYHTAPGERRRVALTSDVSLEMNTRTSIVRRAIDGDGPRIELLSGEAAVRSEADSSRPLTVIAADGRVVAAAAQFNLRHDAGEVRVTCVAGSVQVACRGGAVTLRADEEVVYTATRISTVGAVDPAAITAWQRGYLIFRDEPLVRVVDEINRYRRGRIVLLNDDLGRRRVTARIELARIEEVISYIRSVLGAEVRMLPGGLMLLT